MRSSSDRISISLRCLFILQPSHLLTGLLDTSRAGWETFGKAASTKRRVGIGRPLSNPEPGHGLNCVDRTSSCGNRTRSPRRRAWCMGRDLWGMPSGTQAPPRQGSQKSVVFSEFQCTPSLFRDEGMLLIICARVLLRADFGTPARKDIWAGKLGPILPNRSGVPIPPFGGVETWVRIPNVQGDTRNYVLSLPGLFPCWGRVDRAGTCNSSPL